MFDYCFRLFGLKCNLSVLTTFQQVLDYYQQVIFLSRSSLFSLFNPLYYSFSLYFLSPFLILFTLPSVFTSSSPVLILFTIPSVFTSSSPFLILFTLPSVFTSSSPFLILFTIPSAFTSSSPFLILFTIPSAFNSFSPFFNLFYSLVFFSPSCPSSSVLTSSFSFFIFFILQTYQGLPPIFLSSLAVTSSSFHIILIYSLAFISPSFTF